MRPNPPFAKGDKVTTPLGRVAEVQKVNKDGYVHLKYVDDGDLVILRPGLLTLVVPCAE